MISVYIIYIICILYMCIYLVYIYIYHYNISRLAESPFFQGPARSFLEAVLDVGLNFRMLSASHRKRIAWVIRLYNSKLSLSHAPPHFQQVWNLLSLNWIGFNTTWIEFYHSHQLCKPSHP